MKLARDVRFEVMKQQGFRYLFGNPRTTELPIIDGCTVHPEVEDVMALHEQ